MHVNDNGKINADCSRTCTTRWQAEDVGNEDKYVAARVVATEKSRRTHSGEG